MQQRLIVAAHHSFLTRTASSSVRCRSLSSVRRRLWLRSHSRRRRAPHRSRFLRPTRKRRQRRRRRTHATIAARRHRARRSCVRTGAARKGALRFGSTSSAGVVADYFFSYCPTLTRNAIVRACALGCFYPARQQLPRSHRHVVVAFHVIYKTLRGCRSGKACAVHFIIRSRGAARLRVFTFLLLDGGARTLKRKTLFSDTYARSVAPIDRNRFMVWGGWGGKKNYNLFWIFVIQNKFNKYLYKRPSKEIREESETIILVISNWKLLCIVFIFNFFK